MKYIGLDLGSKTLGIAISDELGFLARALETYRFNEDDYEAAANYIIDVAKANKVTTLILGNPKHMNGDMGVRSQISVDFKNLIEGKSDLKVILEDERLTSVIVDKAMTFGDLSRKTRKQKKDEMAAVVILQNYLDRK